MLLTNTSSSTAYSLLTILVCVAFWLQIEKHTHVIDTAEAREELKKYYIGEVEGGDLTRTSDSRSSEGPSMLMMIAVLAILFAIFVAMKFQS